MEKLDNLLMEAGRLANEDNLAGALKLLMDAPDDLHQHGRYQFAKGTLYFKTRNLNDAIIAFENAVKLGPPLPEFFSNLGVALLTRVQMGQEAASEQDIDRAIESLERAMDMGPQLPHSYVNLGGAWLHKNKPDKARYYFELALELFPDFEPAQLGLAQL